MRVTKKIRVKDMTLNQIRSRDIPWIFFKKDSGPYSAAKKFFQVPVEALLNVDKQAKIHKNKINSESLICFLNQIQFIRLKDKNLTL